MLNGYKTSQPMKKKEKMFQLKLNALIEYGKLYNMEHRVSENGNNYIINKGIVTKMFDSYNVTKNQINKIGEYFSYPTTNSIILLNSDGKFLTKHGRGFKNLSKHEHPELWFIGKKSEWVLQYPSLIHVRLASQFNSFKEFKNYLGFDFISCCDFSSAFDLSLPLSINLFNRSKEDKVNVIALLKKGVDINEIIDCINMANKVNKEISIPKGKESLKELHNTLTNDYYKLINRLVEYKVILENFYTNLPCSVVKSNYELKERGTVNKHCIGSYDYLLHKDLFLVIDDKYDCHCVNINGTWVISQIKGFANSLVPCEISDEITEALKPCKVTINEISNNGSLVQEEYTAINDVLAF